MWCFSGRPQSEIVSEKEKQRQKEEGKEEGKEEEDGKRKGGIDEETEKFIFAAVHQISLDSEETEEKEGTISPLTTPRTNSETAATSRRNMSNRNNTNNKEEQHASYRSTKSAPVLILPPVPQGGGGKEGGNKGGLGGGGGVESPRGGGGGATNVTPPSVGGGGNPKIGKLMGNNFPSASLPATMSAATLHSFNVAEGSGYGRLSKLLLAVRSVAMRDHEFTQEAFFSNLTENDYEQVDRFDVIGPSNESNEVKCYAPKVFRALRDHYKITSDEFSDSWALSSSTVKEAERDWESTGNLFCTSVNNRLVMRSVLHSELLNILQITPEYIKYMQTHGNSLLMRLLCVLRVSTSFISEAYVIVFQNVIHTPLKLNFVCDLLGKQVKPKWVKPEPDNSVQIQSDKDLSRKFYLDTKRESFFRQLEQDLELLQSINSVNYSFVLGVHRLDSVLTPPNLFRRMNEKEISKFRKYYGGIACGDEVYCFGVVDFFTLATPGRRTSFRESTSLSVSVTNSSSKRNEPQSYCQRFLTYLMEIFPMQQAPVIGMSSTDFSSTPSSSLPLSPSPSSVSSLVGNAIPRVAQIGSLSQVVHSIRRVAELSGLHTYKKAVIESEDFTTHSYHDVTSGSANNPQVFPVKEYAPYVFKSLRDMCGVDTRDFITSWTLSEDNLVAKEGAGRSGSLFCFSEDKRFIFKTISHKEVITLLNMLPGYYKHLREQPSSFLMRFLAVYRFIRPKTLYIIVVENVLNSSLRVNDVYDLKGRQPKPGKYKRNKEGTGKVLKDNDLDRKFYLGEKRKAFVEQLQADVNLMKEFNVMDYSLLVGIHNVPEDRPFPEPLEAASSLSVASTISSSPINLLPLPSPRSLSSSLSNLVLKSQFREYHGGFLSHPLAREVIFIGVIDCLTFYGKSKKIANFSKSLLWEAVQLSTVEAQYYAERFISFFKDIFLDTPPPDYVDTRETESSCSLVSSASSPAALSAYSSSSSSTGSDSSESR